jgi:hypothetical protein
MTPGVDMIEVRLRTRAGCSIASVCLIIPPSDVPTTCVVNIRTPVPLINSRTHA